MSGDIELTTRGEQTPLAVQDNAVLTDVEASSPEFSRCHSATPQAGSSETTSNNCDSIVKQILMTSCSDSENDTDTEISQYRTKDRDKLHTDSSCNFEKKGVRNVVRRLSSFHEQIPIRVQNFVLKYTLFFFNFLSWIGGMSAVGIGTWQLSDDEKMITDAVDFVLDPFIILCIIGAITFTVAFLGCVGAAREHVIMLKAFYICLSIVLVLELLCGILVIVFYAKPEARDFLRLTPETLLKRAIIRYMDDESIQNMMDTIQRQFKCCGISATDFGYKDWQLNMYYNCTDENKSIYACAVPESCCIYYPGERMNAMCGFERTNKNLNEVKDWIYTQGCVKGFGEWLAKHEQVILLTACIVMFMQLLGVLFARIFEKRVRRRILWRSLHKRRS